MRDANDLFELWKTQQITSSSMTVEEREAVNKRVLSEAIGMPLFEFKCVKCGRVVEKLYPSFDAMQKETEWQCGALITEVPLPFRCKGFLERQQSAPSFKVNGYNQMTGYSGEQTRVTRQNGIRTEVKGNFEAFDRLT